MMDFFFIWLLPGFLSFAILWVTLENKQNKSLKILPDELTLGELVEAIGILLLCLVFGLFGLVFVAGGAISELVTKYKDKVVWKRKNHE